MSDHLTPQLKAEIDPQTLLDIYVSIVPVDGRRKSSGINREIDDESNLGSISAIPIDLFLFFF